MHWIMSRVATAMLEGISLSALRWKSGSTAAGAARSAAATPASQDRQRRAVGRGLGALEDADASAACVGARSTIGRVARHAATSRSRAARTAAACGRVRASARRPRQPWRRRSRRSRRPAGAPARAGARGERGGELPVAPQLARPCRCRSRVPAPPPRRCTAQARPGAPPRSSTTTQSGVQRLDAGRSAAARCRPWGMRRPPPPSTRIGSTRPQTMMPSPTARLSAVARPPAAISASSSVDRPTPLWAVTSGVDAPARQADACSGARPCRPAHHSAGYCIEHRAREQVEPRPQNPGRGTVSCRRPPAVREAGAGVRAGGVKVEARWCRRSRSRPRRRRPRRRARAAASRTTPKACRSARRARAWRQPAGPGSKLSGGALGEQLVTHGSSESSSTRSPAVSSDSTHQAATTGASVRRRERQRAVVDVRQLVPSSSGWNCS